jgi:uncharacterized protein (DUF433 family)
MPIDTLTVREAGYVANLTYATINRMIDSRRVPSKALVRKNRERMLTVPGVVCVAVEKETEGAFAAPLRKKLRESLRKSLKNLEPSSAGWRKEVSVALNGVKGVIELTAVWDRIAERLQHVRRMHEVIVEDDEIQAGAPTFAGTRILVRPIAAALKAGDSADALLRTYPRLTEEMVQLAKLYDETKPVRGRPKVTASRLKPKSVRRITRPG